MNTYKNTKLNNYTIDDFLKLKPIIYEYCINLTQKRSASTWSRSPSDAEDLYHDVYLYAYDSYFNKQKEKMEYLKFVQIMKNLTYWTFHKKFTKTNNKIINNSYYYQQDIKSEYCFSNINCENIKLFDNIEDHPDYNFLTRYLKNDEKEALSFILKGYNKSEIAKHFKKHYTFSKSILNKIEGQLMLDNLKPIKKEIIKDEIILTPLEYVKKHVINFNDVFTSVKFKKVTENDRRIKIYYLYLQKFSHKKIAEIVNKSPAQVAVEIFRINKKIKFYDKNRS